MTGNERIAAPGLYLHIPFCSAVCPYCDFAVLVGDTDRRARFVEALATEISMGPPEPFERPFDTVYLGGGTPSVLDAAQLGRLLETLRPGLSVAPDARIYLEANPEDVTRQSVAAWRTLGVGTVSLGVQSFDAEALRFLGRRHTADQSRRAFELARAVGFETVSIDLIYGLPGGSPEAWRRELDAAVELAPDHLSCYQLTIEERTVFGVRKRRGELVELDTDLQADLFLLTHRRLAEAGYEGYEVSNFAAAPEHRSGHNAKYWDHTPYLGLGPSAHSFAGRRRWWNARHLAAWQRRVEAGERPIAGHETLASEQLALERLLLGLRSAAGVDLGELRRRYGLDLLARNDDLVARLQEEGLVDLGGGRLRPTLRGLAVSESLARSFDCSSAPA